VHCGALSAPLTAEGGSQSAPVGGAHWAPLFLGSGGSGAPPAVYSVHRVTTRAPRPASAASPAQGYPCSGPADHRTVPFQMQGAILCRLHDLYAHATATHSQGRHRQLRYAEMLPMAPRPRAATSFFDTSWRSNGKLRLCRTPIPRPCVRDERLAFPPHRYRTSAYDGAWPGVVPSEWSPGPARNGAVSRQPAG